MHGIAGSIQEVFFVWFVDQNAGGNPINAEPAGRTAYDPK